MALRVFGADPATSTASQYVREELVGRFRSGHQVNDKPAALQEWRVTTGDPEVASKIHEILGGDAPQEWAAKGEDNLEVVTASKTVDVVLKDAGALRQRMVRWGRTGKPIYVSDGEYKLDDQGHRTDELDPDADLTFAERKQKGRDGTGAVPDIELYFRLAEEPDLGIFKWQTGSWSLVQDLVRDGIDEKLAAIEGAIRVRIGLEEVSFIAKNGPRAGQTVNYTKPTFQIIGAGE